VEEDGNKQFSLFGINYIPHVPIFATNDGVFARCAASTPGKGAPSEPLNEYPDPETHRYLVETVWARSR